MQMGILPFEDDPPIPTANESDVSLDAPSAAAILQILFFLRCLPVFLATPVFWILQNLSLTLSYEYTLSEIPSLASSVSLSFSPRIPPFYPLLQYNPELSALGKERS